MNIFILASSNLNVLPFGEAAKTGIIVALQGMGIVFIVLVVLTLMVHSVSLIYNYFIKKLNKEAASVISEKESVCKTQTSNNATGDLVIDGVEDEGTVAVIMAVVAHNTGSDLSKLTFKSIRLLES